MVYWGGLKIPFSKDVIYGRPLNAMRMNTSYFKRLLISDIAIEKKFYLFIKKCTFC